MSDPFNLCNKLGINYETLQACRKIVERTWQGRADHPTELKTAYEQDRIIESLGPVVIERLVKAGKDTGQIDTQKYYFLGADGNPMK